MQANHSRRSHSIFFSTIRDPEAPVYLGAAGTPLIHDEVTVDYDPQSSRPVFVLGAPVPADTEQESREERE